MNQSPRGRSSDSSFEKRSGRSQAAVFRETPFGQGTAGLGVHKPLGSVAGERGANGNLDRAALCPGLPVPVSRQAAQGLHFAQMTSRVSQA